MYTKILVPVDGSAASNRGLEEAIKLAKGLGASVRLLHAVNEMIMPATNYSGLYIDDYIKGMRDAGNAILQDALSYARKHDVDAEVSLVESMGKRAADLICEQATQWKADLIVMGTHGRRGMRRFVLGSDAEQVLRTATIPILLVRSLNTPE